MIFRQESFRLESIALVAECPHLPSAPFPVRPNSRPPRSVDAEDGPAVTLLGVLGTQGTGITRPVPPPAANVTCCLISASCSPLIRADCAFNLGKIPGNAGTWLGASSACGK